jgi:hypothetical protein
MILVYLPIQFCFDMPNLNSTPNYVIFLRLNIMIIEIIVKFNLAVYEEG